MIKTVAAILSVTVLMSVPLLHGQSPDPSHGAADAGKLAQQLVEDVKHNRPVRWRALRGREDVLAELPKLTESLDAMDQRDVLLAVLNIGTTEDDRRWVMSSAVTAYWVEAAVTAQDDEVRAYAADLLVKYVPDSFIAVHAATLVNATEQGKLYNSLLLGKTCAEEARQLLLANRKLWNVNEAKAKAACAKLGDAGMARDLVDDYQNEHDGRKKASLAQMLGYIGDPACVLALARDMRTPIVYKVGGVRRSLRTDIVAALGCAYPRESVFRDHGLQGTAEIDAWFAAVEKWLQKHLEITWQTERPEPITSTPIPTPSH